MLFMCQILIHSAAPPADAHEIAEAGQEGDDQDEADGGQDEQGATEKSKGMVRER
jgi:hypothetical protein